MQYIGTVYFYTVIWRTNVPDSSLIITWRLNANALTCRLVMSISLTKLLYRIDSSLIIISDYDIWTAHINYRGSFKKWRNLFILNSTATLYKVLKRYVKILRIYTPERRGNLIDCFRRLVGESLQVLIVLYYLNYNYYTVIWFNFSLVTIRTSLLSCLLLSIPSAILSFIPIESSFRPISAPFYRAWSLKPFAFCKNWSKSDGLSSVMLILWLAITMINL